MFLSLTMSIRPSTSMNGWVLDHLSFKFKFLHGSEFFPKYFDANGNWFYASETANEKNQFLHTFKADASIKSILP